MTHPRLIAPLCQRDVSELLIGTVYADSVSACIQFSQAEGRTVEGSSSFPPQWVSNYDAGTVIRDREIPMLRAQAGKVGNYTVKWTLYTTSQDLYLFFSLSAFTNL